MLYQLPNGKVIQITFDQFLSLTDEDIQFFVSVNYGETIYSPWHESELTSKNKKKQNEEEQDNSIDFEPELDEPDYFKNSEEETNGLTIIETPGDE